MGKDEDGLTVEQVQVSVDRIRLRAVLETLVPNDPGHRTFGTALAEETFMQSISSGGSRQASIEALWDGVVERLSL